MVPVTLFQNEKPQFVADVSRVLRGVAEYLGTLPAVLVPLAHMRNPIGVLVHRLRRGALTAGRWSRPRPSATH